MADLIFRLLYNSEVIINGEHFNLYENNWINEHHKVVVISSKTIMLSNPLQNRYPGEQVCEMVVIIRNQLP